MPNYIGKYSYCSSIREFLELPQNEWLEQMESSYPTVCPYPLEAGQIKAWKDCHDVLNDKLRSLSDDMKNLHIIFEYVLPKYNPNGSHASEDKGIRADVIILSKTTSCVLEFKQMNSVYSGYVRQATKYRTRLQNYHLKSVGMNKKTILLLTKASDFRGHFRKCEVCSPKYFIETLNELFKNNSSAFSDKELNEWLNSRFTELHPCK